MVFTVVFVRLTLCNWIIKIGLCLRLWTLKLVFNSITGLWIYVQHWFYIERRLIVIFISGPLVLFLVIKRSIRKGSFTRLQRLNWKCKTTHSKFDIENVFGPGFTVIQALQFENKLINFIIKGSTPYRKSCIGETGASWFVAVFYYFVLWIINTIMNILR